MSKRYQEEKKKKVNKRLEYTQFVKPSPNRSISGTTLAVSPMLTVVIPLKEVAAATKIFL